MRLNFSLGQETDNLSPVQREAKTVDHYLDRLKVEKDQASDADHPTATGKLIRDVKQREEQQQAVSTFAEKVARKRHAFLPQLRVRDRARVGVESAMASLRLNQSSSMFGEEAVEGDGPRPSARDVVSTRLTTATAHL